MSTQRTSLLSAPVDLPLRICQFAGLVCIVWI